MRKAIFLLTIILSTTTNLIAQHYHIADGFLLGTGRSYFTGGIEGAYLKTGFTINHRIEGTYMVTAAARQSKSEINGTIDRYTETYLSHKLGVSHARFEDRLHFGLGLNLTKTTAAHLSESVNDGLEYRWSIWSRENQPWSGAGNGLVNLQDFQMLQSVVQKSGGKPVKHLYMELNGGFYLTRHWRVDATMIMVDILNNEELGQLGSLGLTYRHDF